MQQAGNAGRESKAKQHWSSPCHVRFCPFSHHNTRCSDVVEARDKSRHRPKVLECRRPRVGLVLLKLTLDTNGSDLRHHTGAFPYNP